jgi:hypothetical protein
MKNGLDPRVLREWVEVDEHLGRAIMARDAARPEGERRAAPRAAPNDRSRPADTTPNDRPRGPARAVDSTPAPARPDAAPSSQAR